MNIISLIEENFISIKNDLELILTKIEFNDINEIREQNDNLIDYITKLNELQLNQYCFHHEFIILLYYI